MKKLFALLLAMAFICGVLAGCGTQSVNSGVKLNSEDPVTINIWHYYNGAQKTAFDKLVAEFNETDGMEQGIIVEAFNQGNVSELTESILASANNKVGTDPIPNIFAAYADTAYQIDKLGLVANLDKYMSSEEIAEYIPSYIEEGRLGEDDALKIFPIAKSTEIFMMNKTDWEPFSKATGATLESLSTIEGLVETSCTYYEWTDSLTPDIPDDGKAFFGRDAMANYFIIGCRQLGTEIFSVENGTVTFQIDEKIIKKLWDNYYIPYINGWFAANGRFRSDDAKVGDILALVGSTASATYFPTNVIRNDKDSYPIESIVLPAPHFEGGDSYAVQQGAGMVVSSSTPEEEYASVLFLKWFTEAERNLQFSIFSGYLPVKAAANDIERLDGVLESTKTVEFSEPLKQTIHTAIETVQTESLYTNKAFEGGTKARNVLEYSLSDKASEDAEKIKALISQGTPRKEAVAAFATDENFESWLAELKLSLEKTQKG